jgi:hypothetical protein
MTTFASRERRLHLFEAFSRVEAVTAKKNMRWFVFWVATTITFLIISFVFMLAVIHTSAQSNQEIPLMLLKHAEPKLQTGDLVLFKHEKYDLPWVLGMDRIMSHMGVIWKHPDLGPLLIDMNPTPHGAFREPLPFEPILQGPSVSVLRVSDAVLFYPGSVFVRPLRQPLSAEAEFAFVHKLLTWAMHLEYDESITKRDWITWMSLAFSPAFPDLGDALINFTPLTHTRTTSFCTEMISELFRAAGTLSKRHVSHIWGPIAWQHGIGAGAGDRDRLWDREIQILAR